MSANAGLAFFAAVPIRLILSVVRSGLARMQARLASDGCPIARPLAGGGAFAKAGAGIRAKAGLPSRALWGCREGGAAGPRARHSPAACERWRARPAWRTIRDSQGARPLGAGAGARSPGGIGRKALAARMRSAPARRIVRFGTGSVEAAAQGRRPLPRAGMRLLSADGGVAMGRRGTGPCLRSRAGPALSAAEATRRPGGPGRRRGRLALVAAELVDVMPE